MQLKERNGGIRAELFWDDLCPETQKELFGLMGENGNYDVFPIASINVSNEEKEE